jgi:hypothetical protein
VETTVVTWTARAGTDRKELLVAHCCCLPFIGVGLRGKTALQCVTVKREGTGKNPRGKHVERRRRQDTRGLSRHTGKNPRGKHVERRRRQDTRGLSRHLELRSDAHGQNQGKGDERRIDTSRGGSHKVGPGSSD